MFRPLVTRRTTNTEFAELFTLPGPVEIGDSGDNSYEVLFGVAYLALITRERRLELHRFVDGVWVQVLAGLPQIFGTTLPSEVRRLTAAFDQNARLVVALELEGVVEVIRWDPGQQAYVQNVTFTGVDPQLLMDMTVTDPRGYPSGGWSVQEAYYAGIPVLFWWVPEEMWRETALPDSDILLFYLSADRRSVRCRVQRQLYETVHEMHQYEDPVIMDRATALAGRYQALVSDAATGEPLPEMLVSDPYLGDFIINPRREHVASANMAAAGVEVVADTYVVDLDTELAAQMLPATLEVVGDTLQAQGDDLATADMVPSHVDSVGDTLQTALGTELGANMHPAPEVISAVDVVPAPPKEDTLDANMGPATVTVREAT